MPTPKRDPLDEARTHLREIAADLDSIDERIEEALLAENITEWMKLRNHKAALPHQLHQARLAALPLELAAAWTAAEECNEHETRCAGEHAGRHAELRAAREHARQIAFRATPVERAQHGVAVQVAADAEQATAHAHQQSIESTCQALLRVEQIEQEIADLTGSRPADGEGFRALPLPATANMMLTVRDLGPFSELLDDNSDLRARDTMGSRVWDLPIGAVPPRAVAHRLRHSHSAPRQEMSDHELALQRQFQAHQQRIAELPPPSHGTSSRNGSRRRPRLDLAAAMDRAAEEMSA